MSDSKNPIRLSTIRMIFERFPNGREKILKLYFSFENVRHICDDLVVAMEALRRLEAKNDRDNTREIRDFIEIIDNLHRELIQIVDSD